MQVLKLPQCFGKVSTEGVENARVLEIGAPYGFVKVGSGLGAMASGVGGVSEEVRQDSVTQAPKVVGKQTEESMGPVELAKEASKSAKRRMVFSGADFEMMTPAPTGLVDAHMQRVSESPETPESKKKGKTQQGN